MNEDATVENTWLGRQIALLEAENKALREALVKASIPAHHAHRLARPGITPNICTALICSIINEALADSKEGDDAKETG